MFIAIVSVNNNPIFYAPVTMKNQIMKMINTFNQNDQDIQFTLQTNEMKKFEKQITDVNEALEIMSDAYIYS